MGRGGISLFLVLSVAAAAQDAAVRLSGRIADETNAPVAKARISLQWKGELCAEAISDLRGEFVVGLKEPGEYRIAVEREGFFRLENRSITLAAGDNEIIFSLAVLREVFESIDVTAPPPVINLEKPVSEQRLTGNEILFIPYRTTNNLKNALTLTPAVIQDNRGGLHVDGGAEEQVQYTLDGFNISDPITGRFDSRISVEAVREVEITRGRLSAEFGKGAAGTLAIRTPSGDDKVRYSGTNFIPGFENRKGWVVGDWTPRFGLSGPLLRGRAWFADNLDIRYQKLVVEELPKGEDRMTSWRFSNLLRNQVNLTPSNILTTGFLATVYNAPRYGLGALDPMSTTQDRRARQWFVSLRDQIYFGRGALLELGYAANRTFGREIPQGTETYLLLPEGKRGNHFLDAKRGGSRDQLLANMFLPALRLAGEHQLKTGADFNRLGYWQAAYRTAYENYSERMVRTRRVEFTGDGKFRRLNREISGYLQDSWRVRPKLLVEAGLRADWDRLLSNTVYSPRLGFAFTPPRLDSTKVSGGFAVIYDAASLRMFTRPLDQFPVATYYAEDGKFLRGPAVSLFTIGEDRLRSPRYQNWNLGLEQRLPAGLYGKASFVRRRGDRGLAYANALEWGERPPPGWNGALCDAVFRLMNLRQEKFDSVEIAVRQNFRRQYEWMASYTRSRALSNAVVDISADEPMKVLNNVGPLPWDAPNRLLAWGYMPAPWKNWAWAYLAEWRTGFPFSVQDDAGQVAGAVNTFRFPEYFELNLHVERRFVALGHRWALRFGANNATNRQNPNAVNNFVGSSRYLTFYGGQRRTFNVRIRWLGKAPR